MTMRKMTTNNGTISRQPNGTYRARTLTYQYLNKDGRLCSRVDHIGYFDTEEEAKIALYKYIYSKDITFSDLYAGFVRFRLKNNISPSLNREFKCQFNKCQTLHDMVFKEIDDDDLYKLLKEKGTSKSVTKKLRLFLSSIYNYAIEIGIKVPNYPSSIFLKKISDMKKETERYGKPFTKTEIKKMLRDKADEMMTDIIKILLSTNVKIYELLDLTSSSVDLNENLVKIKDKMICISEETKQIFEKYMSKNYLFTNHLGQKLEYTVFRRYHFLPLMKRCGLTGHSPSDLHATFLKNNKGE